MQLKQPLKHKIADLVEEETSRIWHFADYLISITLVNFLILFSFIGEWGIVSNTPIKIFPFSLIMLLFSRSLKLIFLYISLSIFVLLSCFYQGINFRSEELVFYVSLALFLPLLFEKNLKNNLLAVFLIHLVSILAIVIKEFVIQHYWMQGQQVWFLITKFCWPSLFIELLLVYPLKSLAESLNKIFTWCKTSDI
jgi:hypothetical protein